SRCGLHTRAVTVFRDRYPGASDISSPPCLPRLLPAGAIAGWALHPLIWGIGVKRKFSASRTAFLRKLRRRRRDKRVIRGCSKQRQVRRAASVLSLRQRPHQLISGSVIGTVTIIPHSAGEEAGRWDQSGKAAMSQVGARSHTDPDAG